MGNEINLDQLIDGYNIRINVPLRYMFLIVNEVIPDSFCKMVDRSLVEGEGVHIFTYDCGDLPEVIRVVIHSAMKIVVVQHFRDYQQAESNKVSLN